MTVYVQKNMLRGLGVFVTLGILFLLAREVEAPAHVVSTASPSVVDGVNTPQAFDPTSVSTVLTESSTGREYISNQLIVEFTPEVSEADALAIIANLDGTMLQRFTKVPLFLIRIQDPGDGSGAQQALKKLRTYPNIKSVTLNYLTATTDEVGAQ